MPQPRAPRVARFEDFEVDFQDGELRKQGLGIKLQERALQVLGMLAEYPGLMVTREELKEKLWSASAPVDFEECVDQAINEVREALGDSPDRPRFIEVVDGRRYRFTVPVEWADAGTTQTIGRFRLEEKIGEGGMGVVYRARDERLDRDVALKVLPSGTLADEEARKRFRREALALSQLNHPNIATVYDFDTDQGVDFLVMEYIPGVTLDEKVAAGPLAEQEISRLGTQLAQGLAAAHEVGVVHRDLKPGNLRITPDGRVKILDFGLAELLRPGELDMEVRVTATLSQAQAAMGTLPYMSPEQLQEDNVDLRSDIYAAGAVLYEIATGQRPFVEARGVRLIEAILHQPPRPPTTLNPRVSPQLERIILKALDKDPKRRYPSAKELSADLERLGGLALAPEGFAHRPVRHWFTLLVLVLAATALVAAIVVFNVSRLGDRLRGNANPASIRSLAVLPLENLSGDREQEYFVDGMTDELITDLARIGSLRVISRTSVMQYKGTNKPLPQIARELNVDAVVEGTVMRSGDRLRITAKLVQAPNDKHLWAETYERDVRDVLALQGDVARDITDKVQVKLTSQEHARLSGAQPINPETYEAYLKGRYYMVKWTAESTKLAVEYFDQAIKKDPQYALAYAGLAECYATVWAPELASEYVSRAEAAATKALEIDDGVGEAHTALAVIRYVHAWDWSGAETEFRKALALSPNDPDAHHWYSHFLLTMGRIEESRIESERYLQLDPLSPAAHLHMGLHYLFARQYDQAIEWQQKTLQMEPNYIEAHRWLSRAYERKGMYPQALAEIQKAVDLSRESGESARYVPSLAYIYALSGQTRSAQELLKTVNRTSEHTVRYPIDVAEVYVGLGDRQMAFEWLEKAYAQHDNSLPAVLKVSARFDPLRSDPHFQDLLHRVGLP